MGHTIEIVATLARKIGTSRNPTSWEKSGFLAKDDALKKVKG
jgi:hypothetical protein